MEHERRRSNGRHDDRHDPYPTAGGSAIPARERAWLDSLREDDGDQHTWAAPPSGAVPAAPPAVWTPAPVEPRDDVFDGPIGDPLTGPFLSSQSGGLPGARPHLPAPAVWPGGVPAPVVVSPSWTPPPAPAAAPTPAPYAPTAYTPDLHTPALHTPAPHTPAQAAPPGSAAHTSQPLPVSTPAPLPPATSASTSGPAARPAPARRQLSRREARLRETGGHEALPVPGALPDAGVFPVRGALPAVGALPDFGGPSRREPDRSLDPFPVPGPGDTTSGPRSQRLREERRPATRRPVPAQRRPVATAAAALRRKALLAVALVVTLVGTVMAMNNQRTVELVNTVNSAPVPPAGASAGPQGATVLDRRLPVGSDKAGPTGRPRRPMPLVPAVPGAPGSPSNGTPGSSAPGPSSQPPTAPGGTSPAPAPAPSTSNPGALPTVRNAGVPFATRCPVSATLVPSCGVYWGLYSRQAPDRNVQAAVTGWESRVGRNFDIVLMYYDFSNRPGPGQFPDSSMRALGDKRIPLYSWETRDFRSGAHHRWADVAAGKFDRSVIIPQAQRLKAYGRTVMLGLDHEQDLTYAKHGTAAEYRAMYRHVRQVFAAQGVRNVVWVWATSGYLGDGTGAHVKSFYPGDDLVDWIGYDPYNFNSCHKGPWKTFEKTISRFYTWSAQNGLGNKPLLLQEYGLKADPNDSAKSQQWYRDIPTVLPKYPRLKALVRWDSDTSCSLRIDSQPGMAAAFRDAGLGVQRP